VFFEYSTAVGVNERRTESPLLIVKSLEECWRRWIMGELAGTMVEREVFIIEIVITHEGRKEFEFSNKHKNAKDP